MSFLAGKVLPSKHQEHCSIARNNAAQSLGCGHIGQEPPGNLDEAELCVRSHNANIGCKCQIQAATQSATVDRRDYGDFQLAPEPSNLLGSVGTAE